MLIENSRHTNIQSIFVTIDSRAKSFPDTKNRGNNDKHQPQRQAKEDSLPSIFFTLPCNFSPWILLCFWT